MRRVALMTAIAFTLTGCGTTVSLDRGTFALMYADSAHVVRTACEHGKIPQTECARLGEVDRYVRSAIIGNEEVDWNRVGEVLGTVSKIAIKSVLLP